jgi:hypothetical protein
MLHAASLRPWHKQETLCAGTQLFVSRVTIRERQEFPWNVKSSFSAFEQQPHNPTTKHHDHSESADTRKSAAIANPCRKPMLTFSTARPIDVAFLATLRPRPGNALGVGPLSGKAPSGALSDSRDSRKWLQETANRRRPQNVAEG